MSTTELPSNVDVVFSPAAVNDQFVENLVDTSAAEISVAENYSQLKQLWYDVN